MAGVGTSPERANSSPTPIPSLSLILDRCKKVKDENEIQVDVKSVVISGGRLFVIHAGSSGIFEIKYSDFDLELFTNLFDIHHELYDIRADGKHLFVSNNIGRIWCIAMKYGEFPDGKRLGDWYVGQDCNEQKAEPISMCLNKKGNILTAGGSTRENVLYEYSFTVKPSFTEHLERRIVLSEGIQHPRFVEEKENGTMILVYQECRGHRICMIDTNGNQLKKFDGFLKINFDYPHPLTVDHTGQIIVSDYANGRLFLLDSELQYLKDLVPRLNILPCVSTLYLHKDKDRRTLYVYDATHKMMKTFEVKLI